MARNREAGRAVCQAWRQHPWEPIETVLEPRGRSWVFVVELECSRCDTTKTVEVNRATGQRKPPRYHYGTGYVAKGVKDRGKLRAQRLIGYLDAQVKR